jgi:hypothetical protein
MSANIANFPVAGNDRNLSVRPARLYCLDCPAKIRRGVRCGPCRDTHETKARHDRYLKRKAAGRKANP